MGFPLSSISKVASYGWIAIAASTLLFSACSTSASRTPPPAILTVQSTPAWPLVYVDGKMTPAHKSDTEGTLNVLLLPGPRRLELQHPGFHPHRRDLHVEANKVYTLRVQMVRLVE